MRNELSGTLIGPIIFQYLSNMCKAVFKSELKLVNPIAAMVDYEKFIVCQSHWRPILYTTF